MRQELILCDLDGTLLKSDKTISRRSAMALEKCRERGILVGFATSRGKSNIAKYENQIHPDIVICNGGACVFCEGKLIRAATFSLDETRALLKKAYEICSESAEITLDTLDRIFWNRTRDKSTEYAWDSIFDDFKDFKEPAMKICVQTDDSEKARAIASAVPGCDFLPFSDIPWYKFSAANATKESAIDFLCRHLGISADEITAFGDDHNDIGMLRMCGIGVAMQNAIAEVKEAADALTLSNDEDGVADFVERLYGEGLLTGFCTVSDRNSQRMKHLVQTYETGCSKRMDAQAETFRATRGNFASHTCALTGNIHRDKICANQIKFLINSY